MEEFNCVHCSKKFNSAKSLQQHIIAKHSLSYKEKNEVHHKNIKKYFLMTLLIAAIILFAVTFFIRAQKPGVYDEFAKCLASKGIIIYGNDYCEYTRKQLNFFEKSQKHLNYVKCIDNKELCDQKGIKVTPSWEINGKMYSQVQSLETLSNLTGCKF